MNRTHSAIILLTGFALLGPLGCSEDDDSEVDPVDASSAAGDGGDPDTGQSDAGERDMGSPDMRGPDDDLGAPVGPIVDCDDMAAFFENAPTTTTTNDCTLEDRTTATCCTFTFRSDLREDGPYCPESLDSPPPYGLSVYDGATNPGLRPFNGDYLRDIEADGYDPMVDDDGNTNIVTGLGAAPVGSNCLAMDQRMDLTITVNIPLLPKAAGSPSDIGEVENLGVSIYGIPATGDPPSAVEGPMMGPQPPGGGDSTAINVPSIGACGAHPDPGGYLHDHFIPQVMNLVLVANGIGPEEVECTGYEQRTTGLYGFAKDGYPIYSSRDSEDALPDDLDACNGHFTVTPEFPAGVYHYHADEALAPNYPRCLTGVPVSRSFSYQ